MGFFGNQTYSIETIAKFVQEGVSQRGLLRTDAFAADLSPSCFDLCNNGDEGNKQQVKAIITELLLKGFAYPFDDLPPNFRVSKNNIDQVINWKNPDSISSYILFLALLYHYKPSYAGDAFGYLIDKYQLNKLRMRGAEGFGFYIDQQDVRAMWDNEALVLDFEDKFNILVQLVYEQLYGASCIDELLYQNIGDISAGVSGSRQTGNMQVDGEVPSYRGCWVNYKGALIHLLFFTFGSEENLKLTGLNLVKGNSSHAALEKEGYRISYGKDDSRRMLAVEPFGEGPAIWIRKSSEQSAITNSLFGNVENFQIVKDLESALVKGGLTIPVCGARGAGKTLKLESLIQYVQNFYSIRVLEAEKEASLRRKYPFKNIYSIETSENSPVSAVSAFDFALRSDGDVYVIGDTQDDKMLGNIARTANRYGRNFLFTFLAKSPSMVISEYANALVREKMYSNLQDAITATLGFLKCCVFVTQDVETQQYIYEIFEFVPDTTGHYKIVPIIKYDREANRYVNVNNLSEDLFTELRDNTPLETERSLLEAFRPPKKQQE